jgi:hypothetical protein
VLDPATGEALHELAKVETACGDEVIGTSGRYAVMSTIHVILPSGRSTYQVSLVDVVTGKQSDALDVGPTDNQVDSVAVQGTTLVVVGSDRQLRIAAATKLA